MMFDFNDLIQFGIFLIALLTFIVILIKAIKK